jgi:hypothetical protein
VGTAEQPKFTAQAAEVAKPIMRRSWTITFSAFARRASAARISSMVKTRSAFGPPRKSASTAGDSASYAAGDGWPSVRSARGGTARQLTR